MQISLDLAASFSHLPTPTLLLSDLHLDPVRGAQGRRGTQESGFSQGKVRLGSDLIPPLLPSPFTSLVQGNQSSVKRRAIGWHFKN